ncbi:unnamed protein product [Ectocarpus sp. 13 AM-2016]
MGDNVSRVFRDTVFVVVFLANVVLARVSLCCKMFGFLMVVLLLVYVANLLRASERQDQFLFRFVLYRTREGVAGVFAHVRPLLLLVCHILFLSCVCSPTSATDLRNIVGSDLGQEGIDEIFKEFDLNKDGEIDFGEFKLAMRKADAPGLRLATYRSSSMPHLNVNSSSIRQLERTVQDARKQKQAARQQFGTSGPTPEESMDDMDTSREEEEEGDDDSSVGGAGGGYNRREAVMRASLLRCASDLIQKGPFRRATLEISDPAAKKALRDAAAYNAAHPPARGSAGPDPLARRSSEETAGSAGATQTAVDGWKSMPPQVEEEPHPWGRGEHMVTAATAVSKLVQ